MSRIVSGADYGLLSTGIGPLPGSTRWIERMGTPGGVGAAIFPILRDSVDYLEDDFTANALDTTIWTASTDATATLFSKTAGSSYVAGSTGTTSAGYLALNGAEVKWQGDYNAGMAVRFQLDVVTSMTFEIGFTDALSDETLPAISDIDTVTVGNGVTDMAVIHIDQSQTLTTAAFAGYSSGQSYAAQKVALGTWAPTAAHWYTAVIQMATDTAFCAIYDTTTAGAPVLQASTNQSLTLALDGTTKVRPHIIFGTRNTSAKAPLLDFVRVWQERV